MGIDSIERAVQIDYSARIERLLFLGRLRYRLELRGRAMARIDRARERVFRAEFVLVDAANLLLVERLAGVVDDRGRTRLSSVGEQLGLGEAHRILHERSLDRVRHEREALRFAESETHLRIEIIALRLAVEPVAVGLEMHRIEDVVQRAVVAGGLERVALRIEGAVLRGAVDVVARRR